jgi:hypothetical protein
MDLREKAQRANEVFKKTKNGFISCEYRKNDESLVYRFSDKSTAHSFLLEQQMNFENNTGVSITINPINDTQVIETHLTNHDVSNESETSCHDDEKFKAKDFIGCILGSAFLLIIIWIIFAITDAIPAY